MTNIIIPTNHTLTTPNNTSFTIIRDTAQHIDDDGLYQQKGSFDASVWYDDDRSQTQNNNESDVRSTQILVYNSLNQLVGTYTTDGL